MTHSRDAGLAEFDRYSRQVKSARDAYDRATDDDKPRWLQEWDRAECRRQGAGHALVAIYGTDITSRFRYYESAHG